MEFRQREPIRSPHGRVGDVEAPGRQARTYAVYVDERDKVWLSDWGANAIVRFDPTTEKFEVFPSDKSSANVRQILGRPGEVWTPESGTNRLVVYRVK